MTKYKSFDNTKRKIEKSKENVDKNRNIIRNELLKINTDYDSINTFKSPSEIELLKRHQITNFLHFRQNISISERGLSFVYPIHTIETENAYDLTETHLSFGQSTPVDGTILTTPGRISHWFQKKSEGIYEFNFFLDGTSIGRYNVFQFGWSISFVPYYLTLSLKFHNPHLFREIQSGK